MQGTFIIKAKSAKLTRDTELMGKMDPYCVIKIGSTTQKTQVKEDAGKVPVWEETFKFKTQVGEIVHFEVWDKEKIKKDDLVGSGSFSITQLHVNNKNEFDQEIFYEKKKAGEVYLEIEFISDPIKELQENKGNVTAEEIKETDHDAIVKLQEELAKIWVGIEEEREKAKPVDMTKKKDFSVLQNSINQARNETMKTKDELSRFDTDLQGVIDKFRIFLDEQKQAKKYLEGEHGELGILSLLNYFLIKIIIIFLVILLGATILPGILTVNLIDGEVNNKSEKIETIIAVICGEQIKEFKSKAEVGKNPVWNQKMEFKITTESVVIFVVYTHEINLVNTLGIAGNSLYHVSHGKEAVEMHKARLYDRDLDIGYLNFELSFKAI